jgi:Mg-chelatase subunit ChlD
MTDPGGPAPATETAATAAPVAPLASDDERLRRWRLILGGDEADGIGCGLSGPDAAADRALAALYEGDRSAGLGGSAPAVARWLGDIREYFPSSVVQIMQKDALERLDLQRMLLEPELLETVEPDVNLVGTLISLGRAMPSKTRETARVVIRKVVEEIERRVANDMRQAIAGALNRSTVTRRPRHADIDWDRTIRKNMRHYQAEYRTIIPEVLLGHARRQSALRDVVIAVDQSGSMAASVVYSGVFAAVMASIRTIQTKLVVFDTAVVDLSDELDDPVEVLFGTQLGGGTDINRAVGYCQSLIRRPADTIFVLISDLYEGGVEDELSKRVASMVSSGVMVIVLLALSDQGAPSYDRRVAAKLAGLGAPSFACTPDLFPDLMAAAIGRRDIGAWAAERDLVVTG